MPTRRTRTSRRPQPRRRTARRVARPWTKEECAFMRKFYRRYETAWVARQMGRSVYSVRYKAVDLGIKKASPSVWKGNRGSNNAFKGWKPARKTTTRRTSTTRRNNRSRTWRANNRQRTSRRNTARRPKRRTRR